MSNGIGGRVVDRGAKRAPSSLVGEGWGEGQLWKGGRSDASLAGSKGTGEWANDELLF